MPLDATARMQAAHGTVDPAATSFTPTLPNPTTAGSTLLLFIGTHGGTSLNIPAVDPPWYADLNSPGTFYFLRRPNQPGGETSWAMSSGTSARWAWRVEEWSLSTVGQPDATSGNGQITSAPSLADGTGTATADISDFAALAMWVSTTPGTSNTFPAGRSYSSGWSEVDALFLGDGTGSNDFVLLIAESYPGASGSVSATLTWDTSGGGAAPNQTNGWVTCLRPGIPLPIVVLTA